MHVRPVDMPALRDEYRTFLERFGLPVYEQLVTADRSQLRSEIAAAQVARDLRDVESDQLQKAELFHVSEQMTLLAREAGRTMPEFSMQPQDVPAEVGFCYFDHPISNYTDMDGVPEVIVTASWYQVQPVPAMTNGGVIITWHADTRTISDYLEQNGLGDPLSIAHHNKVSRIIPEKFHAIPYSNGPLPVILDGEEVQLPRPHGWVSCLAALKAIWLLMQQSIASTTPAHYNRADQRKLRREGRDTEPVRVITLRRPVGGGTGDIDREYHHRWIVRGHWRQQWYPSRGVNRPVWIAPHIKGPEDAPLLGGEKVYALKR